MPIPGTAKKFEDAMDPSDKVDYIVDLTPLLQVGESFTSVTLSVLAESALLGFQIETDPPYAPSEFEPGKVRIWASVQSASQNAAGWASGVACGIEFTSVTNSSPPRHYQRTVSIQVVQQ